MLRRSPELATAKKPHLVLYRLEPKSAVTTQARSPPRSPTRVPIPTRRYEPESSTARCAGEFIHIRTTLRADLWLQPPST